MRECFCLLLFLIHFTKGCNVKDQLKSITGYSGGSVLLPCTCKDSQPKPKTFIWHYVIKKENEWIKVFEDEKYKNRLKLFNQSSLANLSLLISDLRKKDEGDYRCQISRTMYKDISVTINGCDLDQNKQTLQVTGHSGEGVLLPCSCTKLQDKPQQPQHHTWTYTPLYKTNSTTIYPNEKSNKHTIRIKLLNGISPGNLSLHISNQTKEDEGEYICSELQQHINITLRVQEKSIAKWPEVSIPLLMFPVLFCVLALIYWKCRGRRNNQQMSSDGLGDVNPNSLTQGQNLKQDENEVEVTYSSVVHVKVADKPYIQTVMMTEHSEYASIK